MELLITLFWIGLIITVGSIVFSIVIYIVFFAIAVIFSGIAWIADKIKGGING
jgi:hypothetical protein